MFHETILYDDDGTYWAIGDDRHKFRASGETPGEALRGLAECFDEEWEDEE